VPEIKERKKFLITIPFEIEVQGRSPYTELVETDLSKLDERYYIEDMDEEEDSAKGT
jgi:hypothetical protein